MSVVTTGHERLFTPLRLREVELRNRLGMAPMSQYSADPAAHTSTAWHLPHYVARARGGVGLIIVEATAVSPDALVTRHDIGLWNPVQREGLAELAEYIAEAGAVPGMQLSHGGRKGSRTRPWDGDAWLRPEDGGWTVTGPSAVPFADGYAVPHEATHATLERIVAAFRNSALLALEAGFRMLELHAGHGRLLHSFLSPIANRRDDCFGGGFDNRVLLLLETVSAVREVWPPELPLAVRLSCEDAEPGGWSMEDTLRLCPRLIHAGVDLIDCTSGGIRRPQRRRPTPGYQVPYATRIREQTNVATAAVGLITDMRHGEEIVATGHADMVLMGRRLLTDPQLPLRSASAWRLIPPPYRRAVQTVPPHDHMPEL